ncbi:MAG TPA: hypothetical protein VGB04_14490 [Allosphingosinicella sp.]|jgi:hypothetical protein
MRQLRDDLPVVSEDAGGPRAWVRPAVERLAAGSAEDGRGTNPDQLNYS